MREKNKSLSPIKSIISHQRYPSPDVKGKLKRNVDTSSVSSRYQTLMESYDTQYNNMGSQLRNKYLLNYPSQEHKRDASRIKLPALRNETEFHNEIVRSFTEDINRIARTTCKKRKIPSIAPDLLNAVMKPKSTLSAGIRQSLNLIGRRNVDNY